MFSPSNLTAAVSNEHTADLRREAARWRAAGPRPRASRLRGALSALVVAGTAVFATPSAWADTPTMHAKVRVRRG